MELKDNEPCLNCGRYNNRAVTIDAVIVRNGKILLIKRGAEPFKGYWGIIGGYVDHNETVENAVLREVMEETGLAVKSMKLIGVYSDPHRHPKQAVSIAYCVDAENDPIAGDDAVGFGWFPIDEIPKLAFDHKKIVDDYLKTENRE